MNKINNRFKFVLARKGAYIPFNYVWVVDIDNDGVLEIWLVVESFGDCVGGRPGPCRAHRSHWEQGCG